MSISMMYQFENNFFFSLPNSSIFLFYPPPLIKYLLCTYGNILNKKSKFSLIKFKP